MSDQPTAARHYQHAEHESIARAIRHDADVVPRSPVSTQVGRLHEAAAVIEAEFGALIAALEPVLGVDHDGAVPLDRPEYPASSPHARELDVIADQFDRLGRLIESTRRRLEI